MGLGHRNQMKQESALLCMMVQTVQGCEKGSDVLGAQCFADKTMLFATACNFSNGFSIEMDGNSFSLLLASGFFYNFEQLFYGGYFR